VANEVVVEFTKITQYFSAHQDWYKLVNLKKSYLEIEKKTL